MQDDARYLVFDGDVDPVWVENLNSVMDDNRLLTLPNGERIGLQSHCRLLFEVRRPMHRTFACDSDIGHMRRAHPPASHASCPE